MEIYGTGHLPDPEGEYWDAENLLTQKTVQDSDLRVYTTPRHNQGGTGSCVAQAVVKALEIRNNIVQAQRGVAAEKWETNDLSRLHLYYLAREMMNPSRVGEDAGTYISLACHVLNRFGVCSERTWPFREAHVNHSPSWAAMREAATRKVPVKDYWRIQSSGSHRVEACIAALGQGFPIVFGTRIGDQWRGYDGKTPLTLPDKVTGGHATTLVGWDGQRGVFIGENSWGSRWGDNGFYTMDPDVIASFISHDFWIIRGNEE